MFGYWERILTLRIQKYIAVWNQRRNMGQYVDMWEKSRTLHIFSNKHIMNRTLKQNQTQTNLQKCPFWNGCISVEKGTKELWIMQSLLPYPKINKSLERYMTLIYRRWNCKVRTFRNFKRTVIRFHIRIDISGVSFCYVFNCIFQDTFGVVTVLSCKCICWYCAPNWTFHNFRGFFFHDQATSFRN